MVARRLPAGNLERISTRGGTMVVAGRSVTNAGDKLLHRGSRVLATPIILSLVITHGQGIASPQDGRGPVVG